MIGFPKTPPLCRVVLALGLLVATTSAADGAPLRYTITDLVYSGGRGLDNDGQVIDSPIRNIVGEYVPPSHRELHGGDWGVKDGTTDGLLLVNDSGYLHGPERGSSFAFVYRPGDFGGRHYDLGIGESVYNRVFGVDINENGDVVGQIVAGHWGEPDPERPFLVSAGTTKIQELIDLLPPDSGWRPVEVYSINDVGQILGRGVNPEGEYTTFLMTPENVPEPGTWAVFGLAAAALAWRNRRRAA